MLKLYRISKEKYASDLSGKGAYTVGGRWNSPGKFMLYSSSSVSLAALEVLVHCSINNCPSNLCLTTIIAPSKSLDIYNEQDLSKEWTNRPTSSYAQELGDRWLMRRNALLLKVPSVINPKESNVLINPLHSLFDEVIIENIEKWEFDARLLR